jgi:hypothetical protein
VDTLEEEIEDDRITKEWEQGIRKENELKSKLKIYINALMEILKESEDF